MSFSSDVKAELAHVPVKKQNVALAELCGMALATSGLSYRGKDRYGLSIQTESGAAAQRYFAMIRRWLGAECAMYTAETKQLGSRTKYVISVHEASVSGALDALQLLDADAPFGMRTTAHEARLTSDEDLSAFLRGAFLGAGTIVDPEKAYRLEFMVGDELLAEQILSLLARLSITAGKNERKAQWIVYVGDGESIAALLGMLGAHKALTYVENIRVMKSVRNDVNRQVNCDNNNLEKSLLAAERQISMIRAVLAQIGYEKMPENLRQIADVRIQYPELSLAELGLMLDPPLGKSGVSARMRKLEALAEELLDE